MNRKAVLKAAFPGGSSGPLAAPAAGSEVMPGRVTADESAGMASPAAGMEDGLEPLGVSAGVSAGKTFQAPFLVAVHKPGSHRRGPPRGRNRATKHMKTLEESKELDQMLSDLERQHEMDQRALLKAALPGGSNGSVPAPDTRREEMPDSATEDVITETGIFAPDPVRLPRIVCPQHARRSCMIGTVVTLFTVPLMLIGCYLGIRKLYQSRHAFSSYLI
ncbi:uncharacterized protein LOC128820757 isoform X1 [Vidua macroura]|uniref:uncharacterized protein LOC128820757 isoform X1 n=1 Tax=Vidua macroura TaxID=187451 RepID=UPI0023A8ECAD|nr:uncharacterized protein LOC128820757 isoform X1 [Vidua macroura]